MHRKKPVRQLTNPPLIYFLAQVRFSEIVNIVKYIPDIQDRLRLIGFPGFRQVEIPQLVLENGLPAFRNLTLSECRNKESTAGIVIAPSFVVFQTTTYTIYEDLEPRFAEALDAVNSIASISITERCGLRYINLVQPKVGKFLGNYLKPEILGLNPEALGVTNSAVNNLFQADTDVGRLIIRFTSPINARSITPPDLQPTALPVSKTIAENQVAALLDFDHFSENRTDFTVESAIDALGKLHPAISDAFESATTPEAFNLWGAQ
jgi:uncharacterized protein (TIGR04255 family)